MSQFERRETLRVMPFTRTKSELYNDIITFQDFYGIQYNTFDQEGM